MPSTILSDNGVSSGTAGVKTTGSNDGQLALQTTTSGGTATTALTIDTSQNITLAGTIQASSGGVKLSGYDVIGGGTTNYLSLYSNSGGPYIVIRGATGGSQGIEFGTGGAEQARITSAGLFQFNSGYGSVATAYGCRAWVVFNGTGTVAIRASGNVSSIGDNGTGDYTVNFTNAMPDANYSSVYTSKWTTGTPSHFCGSDTNTITTTQCRAIVIGNVSDAPLDSPFVNVAIFR
jgi:hypothetical protein